MEILKEVHCRVMKGLGPDWVDKRITVFLDDIEDDTPDYIIEEMVTADAKQRLKEAGFLQFRIVEIHSA
jgi:hypothetical protein